MKKGVSFFLLLLFLPLLHPASAQELKASFSPSFEEPSDLDARIFQCRNGNTLLFFFTKGGIRVNVYDAAHKPTGRTMLSGSGLPAGAVKQNQLCGLFNLGNEVVMFVQRTTGQNPGLYRLSISPDDGKLTAAEKIADIGQYKSGSAFAMTFGGVKAKSFYVQKDPASDAYAIAVFDPFEETSKRIMLKLFDGTHREVSSGYYAFPEERFKYIDYIGMAVRGISEVALCTYEYNTRRSGGKENRLVVSSYKNGAFEQHTIDSANELKRTDGIFYFNPKANLYQLLTLTAEGTTDRFFSNATQHNFSSLIIAISPADYSVVWGGGLDGSGLEAIKKEWRGKRGRYSGVPVYAAVNPDGSFSVLVQEIAQSTSSHGTVSTILGDIGLLRYSPKGEQVEAALIPAGLNAERAAMNPLYLKGMDVFSAGVEQQRGIYLGSVADPGFYYFNYVSTPTANYVFLNQHPRDFDKEPAKTNGILSGVSEANAVGYKVDGDKLEKFHLFGAPSADVENRFALFSTGNYSAETGDYAVLLFEREGRRDKKLHVGWVHCK
jgi:hypothetical protein